MASRLRTPFSFGKRVLENPERAREQRCPSALSYTPHSEALVSFPFGFYLLGATFASRVRQKGTIGRASNNIGLNKLRKPHRIM